LRAARNMSKIDKSKDQYRNQLKSTKQILILGGGFAVVEVLKRIQKRFKNNREIEITSVSKDNFLLFTPMLPKVSPE
jgi:NADH:ubiquinone reductase (H+-translocating)